MSTGISIDIKVSVRKNVRPASRFTARDNAVVPKRRARFNVMESHSFQHAGQLKARVRFPLCPSHHEHAICRRGKRPGFLIIIEHVMNNDASPWFETLETLFGQKAASF